MATTKQPFGVNFIKKNEESHSNAPKKSTMREQCKNMFLEALKETPKICSEDVYRDLSENIENEIFSLFNSDSNKNYRDRVNAIKMKLKGQRNSSIRLALLEARITPSQLVNSDNLAELLEESNTVNKQIKKENPSNIPTKNIPLPTKTFPKTSQPIKNSNIPMPINFQQQLEIPQEQKVFEINPEHNPAKQSNKKNETPKQNISQNTHEHPIHNIEKLPPQKTQEPEKHQTQPPFKSQERSNPPKKTQNIVQNFVKIKETADKHKEVQSQVYKFEKNIENQAVSYQDDQEDIEITYEKKTDNLEIIQDEMEKELLNFEKMRENIKKHENDNLEVDVDEDNLGYENNEEAENITIDNKMSENVNMNMEYETSNDNNNNNNEENNENYYNEDDQANYNEYDESNKNEENQNQDNYNYNYDNDNDNENENANQDNNYNDDPEGALPQNFEGNLNANTDNFNEEPLNENYEINPTNENEENSSNLAAYGSKEEYNEDFQASYKNDGVESIDKGESSKNEKSMDDDDKKDTVLTRSEGDDKEKPIQRICSPQKQFASPQNKKESNLETIDHHFIKTLQLEMDLSTEKQKYQNALAQIEILRSENLCIKNQLDENLIHLAQKDDFELLKRNSQAKEKECEVLKKDLNDHQQELKIMKAHLNKMIEENSRFKDDYMNFRTLCDQEKQSLKSEISALKNNKNDDKMIEIETLKSSNHILEEKIKILSQKLEISKKDCIEKENLLKKMVAFNQQSENDSNLFHNLTSELQKHSTSLNMFNQNDMNMRNNRHLHELNKDTPQQNTAFENISKNDHKTEIQAQKIHENLLIEKNKENSTKLNQTNEEEKNIENNLNSLGEYKETKPETTKKCFDIYQETKKETLQHVDYHKDPKQVVEKQQDKEKPLINKPENNPEKTNMNSESPLKKKENQDLVIKNDQSPNVSKITDISPPAFKKKTEDPPMPIQKKNGAPQNSRTFTPVTFNHPKLANRNNNSSIPVVVTQKIVEQKKIISNEDNVGEQFFNNLANNPQINPIERQNNSKQTKSEIINPAEELQKASPQKKNPFASHNEKEGFKAINPNLFSDQNDDFSQLIQNPSQKTNERKEQGGGYIPKQSSSKNFQPANNRQMSQQGGYLVKGGPNMESTTSIHSTVTEGDIKKGTGLRKGVIPNSLFD